MHEKIFLFCFQIQRLYRILEPRLQLWLVRKLYTSIQRYCRLGIKSVHFIGSVSAIFQIFLVQSNLASFGQSRRNPNQCFPVEITFSVALTAEDMVYSWNGPIFQKIKNAARIAEKLQRASKNSSKNFHKQILISIQAVKVPSAFNFSYHKGLAAEYTPDLTWFQEAFHNYAKQV